MQRPSDLRAAVRNAYSIAAEHPGARHPFPVGRAFAKSLGYPADVLDTLPACAVDAFAGVSNVSLFAEIPEGAEVLDLGGGAGTDALIAARRTGPAGTVHAVDFSGAMLNRARQAAAEAGLRNIRCRESSAERLPLADASIDVALVNGIFNLNPLRSDIFSELARVVRPGGKVFGAELILVAPLPEFEQASTTNWFA